MYIKSMLSFEGPGINRFQSTESPSGFEQHCFAVDGGEGAVQDHLFYAMKKRSYRLSDYSKAMPRAEVKS